MNSKKLNVKISKNTYTRLNRYAKSLNLSIQTIIRFLLCEQIIMYINKNDDFKNEYDKCNPHDIYGYHSDYDKYIEPYRDSIRISDYIYDNISNIKSDFGDKTNIVVNNLIHIGLKKKRLANLDAKFTTTFKDIEEHTIRPSIPLSYNFYYRLEDISNITGIAINKLISLIIGNYLIEHYLEYDDNVYCDENGKFYYDIW